MKSGENTKTVIETRKVNKIRYYIVWVYDDKEVIGFMKFYDKEKARDYVEKLGKGWIKW